MALSYTPDILDSLVQRIFTIEDITIGGPNQKFIVRYRGQIRSWDSIRKHANAPPNSSPTVSVRSNVA